MTATRPDAAGRGLVTLLLRLEGAAALGAGIWLWSQTGASWFLFVALLLVPDLSMLGYLRGPAAGAVLYNLVHTWALAGTVLAVGFVIDQRVLLGAGAVLLAHSGGDRFLGYGLKYPTSFRDTHLGRIGRK